MIAPLAALASADRWLLLKINRDWATPTLNAFLPAITDLHKVAWFHYGAAPAALAAWLWKGGRRAFQVLVVAGLAVGAGDMLAARMIKPRVMRPRPAHAGVAVIVRAPAGGANSFPSNHAVNMGAAASVLSVAYPGGILVFSAAAGVIAYSRVYVGVHYPSDVLAGLALGAAIGWPWAVLMLGRGPGKKRRSS